MKYSKCIALFVLMFSPSLALGQTKEHKLELERSLGAAGYNIRTRKVESPTSWERERFELKSKYRLEVRSRKHVPRNPNYFYRYTVDLEIFDTEAEALTRFDNLRELPPGMDDKQGAEYLMRDGFIRGNRVYIISTNVSMFSYTGLTELKTKLDRSIRR